MSDHCDSLYLMLLFVELQFLSQGLYSHEECHLDLRKITSFASARFIHAEVCGIDVVKKLIKFTDPDRPPMSYDVLSINIGITPKLGTSAWNQGEESTSTMNITPVKPIDGFSRRWDQIIARVVSTVKGDEQKNISFQLAMVGAGAGGVELCLAIYARLRKEVHQLGVDPSFLRFTIVNRGPHIMANHNKYGVQYRCIFRCQYYM
jgi:selenide,water dikinase